MSNARSAKLARWQIWLLCGGGGLLWLSGSAWLLLHYYGQVESEFGLQANPLEPWLMSLHGFVILPVLIGLGTLLVIHIPKGWKDTRQRIAGSLLGVFCILLILSGYLLYYLGDEDWRHWSSLTHWTLGLIAPTAFIWHYVGRSKSAKNRRNPIEP
jgi:hypothetical protein